MEEWTTIGGVGKFSGSCSNSDSGSGRRKSGGCSGRNGGYGAVGGCPVLIHYNIVIQTASGPT